MSAVLSPGERRSLSRALSLLDLERGRFAASVITGAAGLASAVALAGVAAWLIARASQMPDVVALGVAPVLVRFFGISRSVLRYCERLVSHDTALRGMGTLRARLYEILAGARTDTVAALHRGDVLARVGADVDAVGDLVVRALLPMAVAGTVAVATCLAVGLIYWPAALILAVCLLLAGVVGPLLTIRSARLAELARQRSATDLATASMTILESGAELAVSSRLAPALAGLGRIEEDLATARDRAARPAAAAAMIDALAMGLAVIGALLVGIPAVSSGALGPVWLAVIVLLPLAAFEATSVMGPASVQLVRSAGAAERIIALVEQAETGAAEVMTAREERVEQGGDEDTGGPTGAGQAHLEARGLAVGWPQGPVVAEGIDLDLSPGRRVAIVGPSGIGKTTLLLTLAGLLEPKGGLLTLDGLRPWAMARREAAGRISLTAEDAHIFDTTVLENLRVARGDVGEEEAAELLRRTGLGDWLEGLPRGLSTVLGTGASMLSGGERRRLLAARALAAPAPLMVMDEPGEHLEPATADRLVGDLLDAGRDEGRGVLLVTHRLSALAAADEVVVMGRPQGSGEAEDAEGSGPARILARGTHAELARSNAAYRWALGQEEQE